MARAVSDIRIWSAPYADAPKTRTLLDQLKALDLDNVLIVSDSVDENLYLSLRNLPLVDVYNVEDLNARQVLLRRWLVLTPEAFEVVQQKFGAEAAAESKES